MHSGCFAPGVVERPVKLMFAPDAVMPARLRLPLLLPKVPLPMSRTPAASRDIPVSTTWLNGAPIPKETMAVLPNATPVGVSAEALLPEPETILPEFCSAPVLHGNLQRPIQLLVTL